MTRRVVAMLVVVGLFASCTADDPDAGPMPSLSTTTVNTTTTAAESGAPDAGTPESSAPAGGSEAPGRPAPAVGIAVPGGKARAVSDIESSIGARFDIVRLFVRWDTPLPSADDVAHQAAGRRLHLSVRPITEQGRVVPWAELATSEPGDAMFGQMQAWVDRVVALGPGTYVTINHEPETRDSSRNGDPADFVAMWRRFVGLLRERGGSDVRMVWVMTSGSFGDGRAEQWYPGDDVVDVVGADLYNWFTCQGTDRPWVDFAALVDPPLEFARSRGKPLAVPEFASVEDADRPDRKAAWIAEAESFLADPTTGADVEFVAWFDVTAPAGTWPDCVWDHDSSSAAADAFGSFVSRLSSG